MSGHESSGTSNPDSPSSAGFIERGLGKRPGAQLAHEHGLDPDGWARTSTTPGRRSQGGRSYGLPVVIPESEISVSGWAVISVIVAGVSDLTSILLAVVVLGTDDAAGWSPMEGWAITHGWLSVILAAAVVSISAGAMLIGRRARRQIAAARGRKRGGALVRTAYALALLAIIGGLGVLGAHLADNPPGLPDL